MPRIEQVKQVKSVKSVKSVKTVKSVKPVRVEKPDTDSTDSTDGTTKDTGVDRSFLHDITYYPLNTEIRIDDKKSDDKKSDDKQTDDKQTELSVVVVLHNSTYYDERMKFIKKPPYPATKKTNHEIDEFDKAFLVSLLRQPGKYEAISAMLKKIHKSEILSKKYDSINKIVFVIINSSQNIQFRCVYRKTYPITSIADADHEIELRDIIADGTDIEMYNNITINGAAVRDKDKKKHMYAITNPSIIISFPDRWRISSNLMLEIAAAKSDFQHRIITIQNDAQNGHVLVKADYAIRSYNADHDVSWARRLKCLMYWIFVPDVSKFEFKQLDADSVKQTDITDTYSVIYRSSNISIGPYKDNGLKLLFYTDNRFCDIKDYPKLVDVISQDANTFKTSIKKTNFDPDDYYYAKIIAPIEEAVNNDSAIPMLYKDPKNDGFGSRYKFRTIKDGVVRDTDNDDMHVDIDIDIDDEEEVPVPKAPKAPKAPKRPTIAEFANLENYAFQQDRKLTEDEFMQLAIEAIEAKDVADAVNDMPDVEEPRITERPNMFSEEADRLMQAVYDYTEILGSVIELMTSGTHITRSMLNKFYSELFGLNQVRDHLDATAGIRHPGLANYIERLCRGNKAVRTDDFEDDVSKHLTINIEDKRLKNYNGESITFIDDRNIDGNITSDMYVMNAVKPDQTIYYGFRSYRKAGFYSPSIKKTIPVCPITDHTSTSAYKWCKIVYGAKYGTIDGSDTIDAYRLIDSIRFFCSASQDMMTYDTVTESRKKELATAYEIALYGLVRPIVHSVYEIADNRSWDTTDRFIKLLKEYWKTTSLADHADLRKIHDVAERSKSAKLYDTNDETVEMDKTNGPNKTKSKSADREKIVERQTRLYKADTIKKFHEDGYAAHKKTYFYGGYSTLYRKITDALKHIRNPDKIFGTPIGKECRTALLEELGIRDDISMSSTSTSTSTDKDFKSYDFERLCDLMYCKIAILSKYSNVVTTQKTKVFDVITNVVNHIGSSDITSSAIFDNRDIRLMLKLFNNVRVHYITVGYETKPPLYYCYYTMASTKKVGGYTFYPHKTAQNEFCCPNYVVCAAVYEKWGKEKSVKCPVCCAMLNFAKLVKVEPLTKDEAGSDSESDSESEEDKSEPEPEPEPDTKRQILYDIIDTRKFHPIRSQSFKSLSRLDFGSKPGYRAVFPNHLIFGRSYGEYFVDPDSKSLNAEFKLSVPAFLRKLDYSNIVIAGGMCRSILLRQPIQDVDIFFVGLDNEGVRNKTIPLINSIVRAVQADTPHMKFVLMYKPTFNVIELLCVKNDQDTSTSASADSKAIHEDTWTDDFDEVDDMPEDEPIDKANLYPQKTSDDAERELFCSYTIVHKIQIVVKRNDTIKHVFQNFDMHPSCVAYDGSKIIFNQHSYIAYKYMINLIDPIKSGHDRFNYRVLKYYKYGFAIGIDRSLLPASAVTLLGLGLESASASASDNRIPKSVKIDRCKFITKYRGRKTDEIGFFPISEFKIMKRDDVTNEDKNAEEIVYSESMYKSLDTDGDINDLYNYIKTEDIKYCYLSAPIDTDTVDDVLNPVTMEFLVSTRTPNYNFYDPKRVEVVM